MMLRSFFNCFKKIKLGFVFGACWGFFLGGLSISGSINFDAFVGSLLAAALFVCYTYISGSSVMQFFRTVVLRRFGVANAERNNSAGGEHLRFTYWSALSMAAASLCTAIFLETFLVGIIDFFLVGILGLMVVASVVTPTLSTNRAIVFGLWRNLGLVFRVLFGLWLTLVMFLFLSNYVSNETRGTLDLLGGVILVLVCFFFAVCFFSSWLPAPTRVICLFTSFLVLFLGLLIALFFDKSCFGYQYVSTINFMWPSFNILFSVGIDGLSFVFLFLTLVTFPILFLSSWTVTKLPNYFFRCLLGLELLLVLTFTTLDLFYFFVFFEALLIPMFILIGVWGARDRKTKAAYYFFLYTLAGSIFMLFGMLYLYQVTGTLNYCILLGYKLGYADQYLLWVLFFLTFAVKIPLFPFHIWLPEAHVEAPTVGSMLLASLLLKLGGYGFLRISLTLFSDASVFFSSFVNAFAVAGVVYGSLSALRQADFKRIIAYSSVAHMNAVVLGIFSRGGYGVDGAIYQMVAHAVVSAGLFFCIGVLYERTHTRLVRYCGGFGMVMPIFSFFFFVFHMANMGFPGTPNFIGEILIFIGIFDRSITDLFFTTATILFSAAYSVFTFNRIIYGVLKTQYIEEFTDVSRREFAILCVLLILFVPTALCSDVVLSYTRCVVTDIALRP